MNWCVYKLSQSGHRGIILTDAWLADPSNYLVVIDQEQCDLCETCIERCPIDAFSMRDNRMERDANCASGAVCVCLAALTKH